MTPIFSGSLVSLHDIQPRFERTAARQGRWEDKIERASNAVPSHPVSYLPQCTTLVMDPKDETLISQAEPQVQEREGGRLDLLGNGCTRPTGRHAPTS